MAYRKTANVKARLKAQREGILAAAAAVIAKHGRDKSLARVAERADISMGTIYQYFADVDELWAAVVADALTIDTTAMREAADPERTPLDALARAISVFYSLLDSAPRLRKELADSVAYRKGIRAALEPMIGALGIPPRAREQHAAAILGALYGLSEAGASPKLVRTIVLGALGIPERAARAIL